MPTSFQISKNKLTGRFLDFLWQQWSALGVAGQGVAGENRVIDPEAILLATTRFGRFDSRLLDGVIDWLTLNGQRINLQRLRRLHDEWPVANPRVLAAISAVLSGQSVMRKWGAFASEKAHEGEPEPLFLNADGGSVPVFDEPDPNFLRYGLLRGPLERRGMSRIPDPRLAANLLCCLRALFGVNARAEIIGWLLTHESGHPAAIARDTGYFSKSVQHTLNEMEASGHIRSRREGREKTFWVKAADWRFLVAESRPPGFPRWVDWMPVFSAVTTFAEALGEPGLDLQPEQIQAIHLRQALDAAMPALNRAGISHHLSASRDLTGGRLIRAFFEDLEMLERIFSGDTIQSAGQQ
jgi:hypothetical protein